MIKISARKIALLVTLITVCSPGFSQNKKLSPTFLWRITGNGLDKPSFLYGTIHLSDKKLFYFGDSLYHYLEQAEGFNIELDADTLINASMRMWSEKYKGRLLKSLMNKKDYDKYADKLSRTLNKPSDKITTTDVWLAKNKKSAEAYKKGNMQSFMDLYLYSIAKKQGKKVGGIEDLEDQMGIMDDMFDEMDVAYVTSDSLQDMGTGMIDKMKDIYSKQDLAGVQRLSEGAGLEKFKDIVLMRRNNKMARRMDSLARMRSSFFAVGVAHLPGDSGVIDLLRKRGFTVDPVFSSKKIAPESYTYKSIDIPWISFKHDLDLYHVEAPGILQPFDATKDVMDMRYCYDVATGKVYYTAVINALVNVSSKDSIFNAMTSRMSANGATLVSQKDLIKQNYDGRDVIFKINEDQTLHLNIYLAGGYAYLGMLLSKKSELNDKDSKRFFDGFVLTPKSSIAKPYVTFKDTLTAFSVNFPTQPSINNQENLQDGSGDLSVYSSMDYKSGLSYAITVRTPKAGNYIPNDSAYIELLKTQMTGTMKGDTSTRVFTYKGYPAVEMNGTIKADNVYYQTMAVLRGNRCYFLIAGLKKSATTLALADSFFHSFTFLDYGDGSWEKQNAPDNTFSGWFPPLVKGLEDAQVDTSATFDAGNGTTEKNSIKKEFMFYDKATGTSYTVMREGFSEYYQADNDSSLFSEVSLRYKIDGDSIVSFRLLKINGDKAADIQINHRDASIIKKIRLILHGDTLYKIFTYTPRWLADNENTQKLFNLFSINSTAGSPGIFDSKTNKLIADLTSTDSVSFQKAANFLYEAKINKSDLHKFYPLLIKPLKHFSIQPYNANNELIELIAPIADSSTVDLVLQHYPAFKGEEQQLQYHLLKLLSLMNQPYAKEAIVKLLNTADAPKGDAGIFVRTLYNNLPLAKTLFPKIISFTKDTTTTLRYAYLFTRMLDSNVISKQDLFPYFKNFVATAARQQKRLKINKDDYDYNLNNVLDVFGTINNPEANAQLQEYSRLKNLEVSRTAVLWLIKNRQPLPAEPVNRLASSNEYRVEMYDTLKKEKKLALFPAAQLNQKLFASSYLFNYAADEDDDRPDSIKFVAEKTVNFKGQMQKFYLFKVKFGEDEDASENLGVAGPFSLNASHLTTTNEGTGIYWKESYSSKKMMIHFDEYLKELEEREDDL